MHGYKWTKFLDEWVKKATFVKVPISHPKEAITWGIVVYNRWALWSEMRAIYWHVEIKWNDGEYYSYYKSPRPGWSSYWSTTSRYERKVIDGSISNPKLFQELTGFTGYAYYPLNIKE